MTRALSVADLTAYHESCRMHRKPLASPFHLHCRVASKTSSRGNSMNDFRQTAALQMSPQFDHFRPLIEINRNIAAGLSGRP